MTPQETASLFNKISSSLFLLDSMLNIPYPFPTVEMSSKMIRNICYIFEKRM